MLYIKLNKIFYAYIPEPLVHFRCGLKSVTPGAKFLYVSLLVETEIRNDRFYFCTYYVVICNIYIYNVLKSYIVYMYVYIKCSQGI